MSINNPFAYAFYANYSLAIRTRRKSGGRSGRRLKDTRYCDVDSHRNRVAKGVLKDRGLKEPLGKDNQLCLMDVAKGVLSGRGLKVNGVEVVSFGC
ncbi:MAG: hypothetical protein ACXADX_00545 [Candidatus Hodarchaeales archaeon]